MLPIILGAVALGTAGYGVKKCIKDEDFRDNVKDKIQDGAFKACDGLDWMEEKMGLNEYTFDFKVPPSKETSVTKEEITTKKENIHNDFEKLYQLKIDIRNKVLEYKIGVIEQSDIKKDKTKDITITDEMQTNLASYKYLLQTTYSKFKYNMDNKTETDIMQYIDLLKDLFMTKIIKKGKLNDKSTDLILKGTNIILGRKEPIFVELDSLDKVAKNDTAKVV